MQLNTVSMTDLRLALAAAREADIPAMIFGTFGIGKSAVVSQTFTALGHPVVDFRASQILPEDVGGLGALDMSTGEALVQRAVPDMIVALRNAAAGASAPPVLFLDEITSAMPAVQAALYQVALDRRAGLHALPEGTYVVMAGNLATDRGVVEELARPLLNRCVVLQYNGPTIEEFEPYMAAKNFHPMVRTYLKVNPAALVAVDPEQEQSPTPRSWEAASRLLRTPSLPKSLRMAMLAGSVGSVEAAKLEAFLEMHDQLTPVADILLDPAGAKLPDSGNFAATYMQLVALSGELVKRGMTQHIKAAWKYVTRMSPEMVALFIVALPGSAIPALVGAEPTLLDSKSPYFDAIKSVFDL